MLEPATVEGIEPMAEQETVETIAQVPCGDYAVPALAGVRGAIMFEGAQGHIHMRIDDGKVTLSPSGAPVDLSLRTSEPGALLRMVRGEINVVTALLRGQIEAQGDLMLLIKVAGALPKVGLRPPPRPTPTTTQPGAE